MSKKKKSHKKHQFKHSQSSASAAGASQSNATSPNQPAERANPAPASVVPTVSNAAAVSYEVADLALIKRDVRKVLIMAGSFVVLQVGLWLLFNHTGLGNIVYHL